MRTIVSVLLVLLARPHAGRGGITLPLVSPLTVTLAVALSSAVSAALITLALHRAARPRGRGFAVTCGCGRPLRARVLR